MAQMNFKLKAKIVERYGYQIEFADAIGVDQGFVSRVIKGRQQISDELKRAWADRLGCKVSEIFPKE